MTARRKLPLALIAGGAIAALGACSTTAPMAAPPAAPPPPMVAGPEGQPGVPFSGAAALPENQAVVDQLKAMGLRPYHTLTPQAARQQPTFADGVMAVMQARGMPTTPPPGTTERDISIPGPAGPLHALMITPTGANGKLPVILYFHGGGWVIADSKTYAGGARGMARLANAIVISVDYRRAPEAPFPAQHDDALASYRWVLSNAASLGGDPSRIAFAGESAGGNLSVATAMLARDAGLPMPRAILSVYPIAGSDLNTPSYQDSSNGPTLSRALMAWFFHYTARTPADLMDPRINLVHANLSGLPPVTIVSAEIDPLRSEGELLAQHLQSLGVPVERRVFPGTTHEFFGADALIPAARDAQAWAGGRLRDALWGGAPAPEAMPASNGPGERG
jgi:acetyl esterase